MCHCWDVVILLSVAVSPMKSVHLHHMMRKHDYTVATSLKAVFMSPRAQKKFTHFSDKQLRVIFIPGSAPVIKGECDLERDRVSKVHIRIGLAVPDADRWRERGVQTQLRPCSMEHYESRNQ